ncbi:MAG: Mur ligase family protein [Bacillota bacterium]|nr:Mur ligase family protein [Bacillota bacterium]
MKLKDLLKGVEIQETKGTIDENLDLTDVCFHSAKVKEGAIFVAIKGHETDGHKYIQDAISRGAALIFVEEFQDITRPQIKVADGRIALADLSANFFDHPSKKLKVVGITATNGKTTTSYMVEAIFKEASLKVGVSGTVDVRYGDVSIPSILTTPESRDLQEHTKNMVEIGITDLVMEVSSHAQEMYRARKMDFDIVTFNNLSREHIDQHGSFENYAKIKSRLIKEAKEEAYVILNFDEDYIKNLASETKGQVLSYSFVNQDQDFGIANLDFSTGYPSFDFLVNKDIDQLNLKKGSHKIQLGLAGYSSVMNSVAAIVVALVRGIDFPTIERALRNFKGVERRFQVIYDQDFMIVDDHYANARNISVTMETISMMTYKNFHILYGIRGNRGVNLNREAAEESAKWLKKMGIDTIYSSSSSETVSWKDEVSPEEKAVFDQVMKDNGIKVVHFDRLDQACYNVLDQVEDGDLLLLAGCQGMDPGGRIVLEKLTENMDQEKRSDILKVLDGRAF